MTPEHLDLGTSLIMFGLIGYAGWWMAGKRGWNQYGWTVGFMLFGVVALFAMLVTKPRRTDVSP